MVLARGVRRVTEFAPMPAKRMDFVFLYRNRISCYLCAFLYKDKAKEAELFRRLTYRGTICEVFTKYDIECLWGIKRKKQTLGEPVPKTREPHFLALQLEVENT